MRFFFFLSFFISFFLSFFFFFFFNNINLHYMYSIAFC